MHIMAPLANLSYPLQFIARRISRLAAGSAGSARPERKMRYQRRNSCSNSTTKIQRFFGESFCRSKSPLAERYSEASMKSGAVDAPDLVSLSPVGLDAERTEVLAAFDKMLASYEGKPHIPPKPDMYAIPDSLYRQLKKMDDTKKDAANALQGEPPLHHLAAGSAAWGPS